MSVLCWESRLIKVGRGCVGGAHHARRLLLPDKADSVCTEGISLLGPLSRRLGREIINCS